MCCWYLRVQPNNLIKSTKGKSIVNDWRALKYSPNRRCSASARARFCFPPGIVSVEMPPSSHIKQRQPQQHENVRCHDGRSGNSHVTQAQSVQNSFGLIKKKNLKKEKKNEKKDRKRKKEAPASVAASAESLCCCRCCYCIEKLADNEICFFGEWKCERIFDKVFEIKYIYRV